MQKPWMHLTVFFYFSILLAAAVSAKAAGKSFRVTVSAGDFDRRDTPVAFMLPEGAKTDSHLRDTNAKTLPLQADALRHAAFILESLKKGESKTYELVMGTIDPRPRLETRREGGVLRIAFGGKPVMQYQAGKSALPRADLAPIFQRGGYLHPITSPSGKIVTDDYPSNHKHHHGIWFPWTKTEFEGRHPDFWNMGDGKGTVEFVALGETWNGPVHGGFQTQHRFVDLTAPEPKVALNELWEVKVYAVGQGAKPYHVFDLVSTQQCASSSPLKLPQYYYGGLGFRGNFAWNGKNNTFFLTSEGETDRVKGNETRGRWCHVGGKVDGELTGIAILCHPDNFRAPQPMRLHPSEPFFCFAPQQSGDMQIEPGKPYVSRYRFVVADGAPDPMELERLWNDYAHPPTVTVAVQGP